MIQVIREPSTRAVRLAAIGGVVGPALFAAVVLTGGVLYDGYSHSTQKISELGGEGARYALLQNTNFVVLGLSIIGFSWAMAQVLGRPLIGPIALGIFGLLSSIANGLLPCDVGCQGNTTVGQLHNITGLFGFISAIVGIFVLTRRWSEDPIWKSHVNPTRIAGLLATVGLVAFVTSESSGAFAGSGIYQRIFVGVLLLWVAVTAIRLIGEIRPPDPRLEPWGR